MPKISRSIKRASIGDKLAHARAILGNMKNKPDYAAAAGVLADYEQKTNDLAASSAAKDHAHNVARAAKNKQDTAEQAHDAGYDQLASFVEHMAGDDVAKYHTAGFKTYQPGAAPAVGKLEVPEPLYAASGEEPGYVNLKWKKVRGARAYLVQCATTPNDEPSWRPCATSTSVSCTVKGLTPGTVYTFRVAAIGTAGQGPWSNTARHLAP